MSQPTRVNLKRKATEDAPDVLILEARKGKRAATQLHYVRASNHSGVSARQHKRTESSTKRVFQLDRQNKSDGDEVATVTERRSKAVDPGSDVEDRGASSTDLPSPLKRTSGRAVKPLRNSTASKEGADDTYSYTEISAEDRSRMEQLSDYVQQEISEQDEREQPMERKQQQRQSQSQSGERTGKVVPPKLSAARSAQIHQRRMATNNILAAHKIPKPQEDVSDYVYDTYILTSVPTMHRDAMDIDNVGYLIITEEDEELWEQYIHEEAERPSDESADEDDEDENAEDYYGADYPEHDLDSEDEFDRGAYGYRHGGASDEEEWDEDTGALSGDEDSIEGGFGSARYQKMAAEYLKT